MTKDSAIILLILMLFLCLAVLITGAVYFLREWKKLDNILESFQKNDSDNIYAPEYYETRESRIASQLRRILDSAHFKEKQALKEKDQITELISDLSHQLKTPLANIVMNMEILQDDTLTEEKRREFLEHTKSQADKMTWLMKNLLKASRLENGIIQFNAEYTGVKETIARALEAVYAQAAAKNILLSAEEFPDFSLYQNPKWTAEAMSNILENAVKYSPENSHIRITAERLDIYTRIMITDEGMGIPESDYNNIFKRFYRGENVAHLDGNGLGLYLAQLILQQEKGYITVSSQPGRGSSFSLFLLNAAP